MDQIISRKNQGARHFGEDDWTIFGWQDRRLLNDTGMRGKDDNRKASSKSNTVFGVVYVGVLVIFMLVYLT